MCTARCTGKQIQEPHGILISYWFVSVIKCYLTGELWLMLLWTSDFCILKYVHQNDCTNIDFIKICMYPLHLFL